MRVNLDHIKALTDEKGWSQAELVRKMHLSRAYISRLFSGERIGGKELLGGIMTAFPENDLKEFILGEDIDDNADTDEEAEADDCPFPNPDE